MPRGCAWIICWLLKAIRIRMRFIVFLRSTRSVVVTAAAMEAQLQIVFGKNTQRAQAWRGLRSLISDEEGVSQVVENSLKHARGGLIFCEVKTSSRLGHSPQSCASVGIVRSLL